MGIIKPKIRTLLIFVVILILIAMLVIAYTYYSKSKETQAFYTSAYTKAFEQTDITSDFIETILENKNDITSQEISSQLSDIHNSLDILVKDFELISSRFSSNELNTNNNFMRDLFQLYSDEITRLQSELLKNNSQNDFDDTKGILFTRLALMNADLQKIIIIDTPQFASYTYDQTSQAWVKLVKTLGYREVTRPYKLRYPHLFTKGPLLPFKK